MCEQFVAWAAQPFRIDELWPFTGRLERFGIARFGWGAAWRTSDGCLSTHRDVGSFAEDDEGRARVGREETTSLLVHLRRPSRLSTIQLADTQPFEDPRGRFALSHNGELRDWRARRAGYRAAGRIGGRADSEVGARWLEDAWQADLGADAQARALHEAFRGTANLALVEPNGRATHYAGNAENPVFAFELAGIRIAATGIYSIDRSLFRFVASGAHDRRLVSPGMAITLGAE
jgi:predicted glutamine amidotransferase